MLEMRRHEGSGPVRVLMRDGQWTGRDRVPLREPPPDSPERRERKPISGALLTVPGECEMCGAAYLGPPNKRRCDRCGK